MKVLFIREVSVLVIFFTHLLSRKFIRVADIYLRIPRKHLNTNMNNAGNIQSSFEDLVKLLSRELIGNKKFAK